MLRKRLANTDTKDGSNSCFHEWATNGMYGRRWHSGQVHNLNKQHSVKKSIVDCESTVERTDWSFQRQISGRKCVQGEQRYQGEKELRNVHLREDGESTRMCLCGEMAESDGWYAVERRHLTEECLN